MRQCPTGLRAIANYIEIGRGPSKSSGNAISPKERRQAHSKVGLHAFMGRRKR
jgi:hypothetical protein